MSFLVCNRHHSPSKIGRFLVIIAYNTTGNALSQALKLRRGEFRICFICWI